LGGWLCFGEGNILEQAGIHTHTRVHKEHWIFILATRVHPWTFHTQAPHTNPQSFTASRRPYHVHKPSHLEAPAQAAKSQVPTATQELTFTHSTARRDTYTATAISESHTTVKSCPSSFSHAGVCMRPPHPHPSRHHTPHTQSENYLRLTKRFNHTVSGTHGATQSHLDTQSQSRVPSPSCSSYSHHTHTY